MNLETINKFVWLIPFKSFRNIIREYFIDITNINNTLNSINNTLNNINNNSNYINSNLNTVKDISIITSDKIYDIYSKEINLNKISSDPKRLENYGYKVYSQTDEDGIINEIFNRIGVTNKFFIEFGVQDGIECNCHYLLMQGWEGVFIEGNKDCCNKMNEYYNYLIYNNKLKVINAFITKENINDLISTTKAIDIKNIDLLSIDIDGNDYHVFKAIDVVNPRVVIIEYNVKFPPPVKWVMPYNPEHIWDGTENHGASLESIVELAKEKGYELVATNINGVNAFFVRKELYNKDIFPEDNSAKNLNNFLRYGWHGHKIDKEFLKNYLNK